MKTLWREKTFYEFLCPLCRTERRISLKPNPWSAKNVARVGIATALLMLLSWNWLGGWGVFFFVPVWTLYETFYRLNVRKMLTCESCGLDPILYLADVKRARAGVEKHFEGKRKAQEKTQKNSDKSPEKTEAAAALDEAGVAELTE
jgi:hypothetical protein